MVGFTFAVSDLIFKYFNSASTYQKIYWQTRIENTLDWLILKIYIDAVYT
jgi:hypothetical protein